MSTDLPTQRGDDCSPDYLGAVDDVLALNPHARRRPPAPASPTAPTQAAPDLPARAVWAAIGRGIRSGLVWVLALAALLVIGVQGGAAVVDWWAPTAGPSACSEVVLPMAVMLLVLAVVGLAGAVVREIAADRRGRST